MANEIVLKKVPSCKYNHGVGCPYEGRKCWQCGFKPDVSYRRIKDKYGIKYTKYLSPPVKKG